MMKRARVVLIAAVAMLAMVGAACGGTENPPNTSVSCNYSGDEHYLTIECEAEGMTGEDLFNEASAFVNMNYCDMYGFDVEYAFYGETPEGDAYANAGGQCNGPQ